MSWGLLSWTGPFLQGPLAFKHWAVGLVSIPLPVLLSLMTILLISSES